MCMIFQSITILLIMFSFFKQVFVVLFSFSSSLATKYLFLNDEPCIVRPTLIDKITGTYNTLFPKVCVPKYTKDINVTAFNIIRNKNEAKAMTEHISCDCKCKFNSTRCN